MSRWDKSRLIELSGLARVVANDDNSATTIKYKKKVRTLSLSVQIKKRRTPFICQLHEQEHAIARYILFRGTPISLFPFQLHSSSTQSYIPCAFTFSLYSFLLTFNPLLLLLSSVPVHPLFSVLPIEQQLFYPIALTSVLLSLLLSCLTCFLS